LGPARRGASARRRRRRARRGAGMPRERRPCLGGPPPPRRARPRRAAAGRRRLSAPAAARPPPTLVGLLQHTHTPQTTPDYQALGCSHSLAMRVSAFRPNHTPAPVTQSLRVRERRSCRPMPPIFTGWLAAPSPLPASAPMGPQTASRHQGKHIGCHCLGLGAVKVYLNGEGHRVLARRARRCRLCPPPLFLAI
jgi:hypothetical protein